MDNINLTIKKTWSMRLLCFLAVSLICSTSGYASENDNQAGPAEIQQQRVTVRGKVTNTAGEPVAGVTVGVQGTTTAVLTDGNGNYSITAPSSGTLTYTFWSYTTATRVIGTQTTIDVILIEDLQTIDDVVVVGYGSQRAVNLTGSVTSVNVDKTLASRPIADVGRGLQGSVPGLSVVVRSGEVGSDPSMKIRGAVGSQTGSANPLILVDNVEIPSIQILNPDDIESITILKDAASTSIYGSKGAFGVILITTKKGANTDVTTVTYSGNVSWQDRAKPLRMGAADGLQYTLDAFRTRDPNNTDFTSYQGGFMDYNEQTIQQTREWIEKYSKTGLVKPGDPVVYGRDWYTPNGGTTRVGIRPYSAVDAMVRNWAPTMTHNLSVNGRASKTSFNIGLGMLDQSGMAKTTKFDDFRRYNATIKLSTEINKYLTIRAGAMYSDRIKRYPSVNNYNSADPWLYAYRWSTLLPVGVSDQFGNILRDAAWDLSNFPTSKLRNVYTNINLGATVNFTKDWKLEFDYTYWTQEDITERAIPLYSVVDSWFNDVVPAPWYDEDGERVYVEDVWDIDPDSDVIPGYRFGAFTPATPNPFVSRNSVRRNSHIMNVYSNYDLKLGDLHQFTFMAGMNRVANDAKSHFGQMTGLFDFDNPQFNFTSGTATATGTETWDAMIGFFGRVNYSFADKYLLEANLRYDGTSKFPKAMWWSAFPSVSAGWVISNENFFEPVSEIMNFAKVRASWGSMGDQSVSNALYLPIMSRYESSWLDNTGKKAFTYATPNSVQTDVRWQRIENIDIGVDLQFFRGKLGVVFDWYQRYTKDMIIPGDALPHTYGAIAPQGNFGNLRTRGWEVQVTYNHRFRNGLGISALATMWDNQSFTTKGADWATPWEDREISNSWNTGARYGDIWGYVTDRLYQEEDFIRGADGKFEKVTIVIDGVSKQSYRLAGDNPVYQTRLEDGGGVVIFRPGDVKFKDLNGDGYITPGLGTFGDPGDRKVIGNTTPRYEYGFRLGMDWKGFDFSIFIQGVGSRQMWGAGQLAIPGFNLSDGGVPQTFADDYWRPDNTGGFYPRPWNNQNANTNYSLQVQSKYLLNMAYTRIKNITLGYSLPASLLKKAMINEARFYVSLENFFTFDKLRGLPFDPEVQSGYSMFATDNYNQGRTGQGTPMFKSASVGVQLSF
jgi:TonB-linked SusC/RagA family outer membrane protein